MNLDLQDTCRQLEESGKMPDLRETERGGIHEQISDSGEGKKVGTNGDVGCFSMQAGKLLPSGEGGTGIEMRKC